MDDNDGQKGSHKGAPASNELKKNGAEKSDPKSVLKNFVLKDKDVHPVPKLVNNRCLSCKDSHSGIVNEVISCQVCNTSFHALCKTKRGSVAPKAIAPGSTFMKAVRPVIAKYSSHSERWGYFSFTCEKCHETLKALSTSQTSKLDQRIETASIGTVTDQCFLPSDKETKDDLSSVVPAVMPAISAIVTKNVETLFGSLQENMLSAIEEMITDKIRGAMSPANNTPLASSTLLRRASSDSGSSSDSCFSSMGQSVSSTAPSSHGNIAVDPPSKKSFTDLFSDPLETPKTVNVSGPTTMTMNDAYPKCVEETDHILVLRDENSDPKATPNLHKIEEKAGKILKNVPLKFMKTNVKSKKIVFSFPTDADKKKGLDLINDHPDVKNGSVTLGDAKKMYPKITAVNVPNYLTEDIMKNGSLSSTERRSKLRTCLESKFLEKNEKVKDLVENGGNLFQVIYVNVGANHTSVGVKVSPVIRNLLMEDQFLYVGNTRCKVLDRFDIRQCFKCQRIGHTSHLCPEPSPICMFCGASHLTRFCPDKDDRSKHRCTNCSHSNHPKLRDQCASHHSGSNLCPIIIQEKNNLKKRTEYSKNM